MSKIGNKFKKLFLSCYSNAEEKGVLKDVRDLTVTNFNTLIDASVPDQKNAELIKAAFAGGLESMFEAFKKNIEELIDKKIEAKVIKAKMVASNNSKEESSDNSDDSEESFESSQSDNSTAESVVVTNLVGDTGNTIH
ncbi:MAG: hypothetical protein K0R02_202 [Rickettsiaceae bacterium]|jgi:hypothetical protein|nr:hypothetical protein [Rickettsiaceae bacterium]